MAKNLWAKLWCNTFEGESMQALLVAGDYDAACLFLLLVAKTKAQGRNGRAEIPIARLKSILNIRKQRLQRIVGQITAVTCGTLVVTLSAQSAHVFFSNWSKYQGYDRGTDSDLAPKNARKRLEVRGKSKTYDPDGSDLAAPGTGNPNAAQKPKRAGKAKVAVGPFREECKTLFKELYPVADPAYGMGLANLDVQIRSHEDLERFRLALTNYRDKVQRENIPLDRVFAFRTFCARGCWPGFAEVVAQPIRVIGHTSSGLKIREGYSPREPWLRVHEAWRMPTADETAAGYAPKVDDDVSR